MSRIPRTGNIEITHKCNFNCHICYNGRYSKPDMTTEQIKKLFKDFADEGCFFMHFSGGEPLIRSDFCELYKYCVSLGIRPSIESNGSLLNKDHIELFKLYPPLVFYMSIYAISPKIFHSTTQADVKFNDIVIKNAILLRDSGIQITLRTPISIFNYMEADKIYDFC